MSAINETQVQKYRKEKKKLGRDTVPREREESLGCKESRAARRGEVLYKMLKGK